MTIEPATDYQIAEIEEWTGANGTIGFADASALIARIRIEREKTIRECAEAAGNMPYVLARDRILSLLKAPSNQEGGL